MPLPLVALRAVAAAKRARVTAKVARMRRVGGVTDLGDLDPRRALKAENALNRRSVEKYVRDMDSFLSRKVQYVGDSKGRPIPKAEFMAYKKTEALANLHRTKFLRKVEDLPLPGGYSKVGHHIRMFGAKDWKPNMLTDDVSMPTSRESTSFTSANAMRKVKAAMEKELDTEFGMSSDRRKQAEDMLNFIGNDRLTNKLKKLDNFQLATLWKGSGFLNALISLYDLLKQFGEPDDKDIYDVEHLLDWAGDIVMPDDE